MARQKPTQRYSIQHIQAHTMQQRRDELVLEEPLELRLQFTMSGHMLTKSVSITMRTPGEDYALAAGFLFTEDIISSADDIEKFDYCVGKETQEFNILTIRLKEGATFDPEKLVRHFYTTSSCGVCGKASIDALEHRGLQTIPITKNSLAVSTLYELPDRMREAQAIFEKTGGLHAAGLFSFEGELIDLYEDIGRHNAVDKLIGARLLDRKLPLQDTILLVSGRLGFEITQKAISAGLPIVASVGAPSHLSVELARRFQMTLVGFVREQRCNVYSIPTRLDHTR